ncbi:hypothetical protein GGR57DRAFT_516742 [Xylariaceae sp. FL1272]|nr:hypothetical protein GGR57DRAFT_516742 [Xylariaceae sp. FL1272]
MALFFSSSEPTALRSFLRQRGSYNVGMKRITIPNVNTGDPIAPKQRNESVPSHGLLPNTRSLYRSALAIPGCFLAALFEDAYNVTAGSFANLTTGAIIHDARFLEGTTYPTLLFGPPAVGPPIAMFSILLPDLASCGYTVIDNLDLVVRSFGGTIKKPHIGALGHYVGGGAASDGPFWSEDETTDAMIPILLLGQPKIEGPSWIAFAPVQTAWYTNLRYELVTSRFYPRDVLEAGH